MNNRRKSTPEIILGKVIRSLALLLALAFVFPALPAARAATITLVTDKEKEGGFLVEITKAAFKAVGHEVRVEYLPWARALSDTMNGKYPAILGVYYTPERAKAMLYSDEIAQSDLVFFKLKKRNISFDRLEDLEPYTIGTIIGAAYTPEFEADTAIRKEAVSDPLTNIKKLSAGRIDAFIEKKLTILNTLKTQFPDDYEKIDFIPKPMRTNRYYNAFSRKYPGHENTVADFNRGLKIIIDDGTYAEITRKALHE